MQQDECSECACDKTREKEKKEYRRVFICWYEPPPCQKYWFLCVCVCMCKGNEHMWVRDNWEKWLHIWIYIEKKLVLKTEYWICIYPRKIHLFNYELVCMCALQTDRGIYCVCIKCVCVLMIYLPWSGLCFQFGGCQSSGWWSVRAGSLMHVERAGSIGARQCLCHQTHTQTHTQRNVTHKYALNPTHCQGTAHAHGGAHTRMTPSPRFMYFICVWSKKASEMTGNYYLANLPRNRIKQQRRPSESWIQTVRSGSVYLLNHHEEPH